jgi:hypothetical protein
MAIGVGVTLECIVQASLQPWTYLSAHAGTQAAARTLGSLQSENLLIKK